MARRRSITSVLAGGLAAVLAATVAVPAGADPVPEHGPPVEAPVVDPFRAPPQPWQAGNRGIEYGTPAGTEVRATADGTVAFAGVVAGTRHVTVRHEDDVRTSYSFLDRIDVVVGQRVRQGDVLGTTAGNLHLGARRGDAYFDPASLFAAGPVRVRLVPFEVPPASGAAGERGALRQLVGGVAGALGHAAEAAGDRVLRPTGATIDWLRENGTRLARVGGQYLEPLPIRVARRAAEIWADAQRVARRPCTAAGIVPEPPLERRVAITVGGLGSTSEGAAIDDLDTAALGYEPGDVVRFSYRGGRTPGTGDRLAQLSASAYDAGDTQGDLHESGRRLADLVEQVVAAAPGTVVDLFTHSLGGVVARLALLELEARHGRAWLERLGLVATLGSPHGGADLASGVDAVGSTGRGSMAFDAAAALLGIELDDDAPAVAQLSEGAGLVHDLANREVPDEVELVSIAARGDLTVTVPRTEVPGGLQVVVAVDGPQAHDDLPGSPAAQREIGLALAGQPPTCRSFEGALLDQAVGELISLGEDNLAAFTWWAAGRQGKPLGG